MKTLDLKNPSIKKEFGIFVGFFNKVNKSKFSVESAAKNSNLTNLYLSFAILAAQTGSIIEAQTPKRSSTKSLSYSLLDAPKVDREVYDFLAKNPPKTRAQISKELDMRLSTVCGAVNRLIQNNLVQFTGELVKDTETNRLVELVTAIC
jgi:hypothetical protein